MADPITMALVGTAAAGTAGTAAATTGLIGSGGLLFGVQGLTLGAAMSGLSMAFGAVNALSSASASAEAQRQNSRMAAEESARVAVERDQALRQQQRDYYLFSGKQRATAAAGAGADSSFDLLADSAIQNELDILTISANAQHRMSGIKSSAELDRKRTGNPYVREGAKLISSFASR